MGNYIKNNLQRVICCTELNVDYDFLFTIVSVPFGKKVYSRPHRIYHVTVLLCPLLTPFA